MSTATPVRGLRALSRVRLPRPTIRRAVVVAALGLILLLAWLWVRSSSLVAIRRVQVVGLSGPDVRAIRSALTGEALTMTTLDLSTAKLESAVSRFPHIAGVRVRTHFPHGATIIVDQQLPVAALGTAGAGVAVDAAGQVLSRTSTAGLPGLPLAADTAGNRVTAASTLAVLAVLGAAPYQMLPHVQSARSTARHGVTLQLRNGPALYFGDSTRLAAKWSAVDATLASSDSAGASYIDVSAPDRPAAGIGG